jgi:pyruvate/2-oxoglutarate dehydrogenase complex dihydrolipoamide acyltransferase (E2) component
MTEGFQTTPFPRNRGPVVDAGRLAARRHVFHGLLEIDVTRARRLIRDHTAATGERLSFTGFIITCLAEAVEAYPMVQAYRNWRNQLVVFDDVDVVTLIETKVGGVALPHIIRAANQKSLHQVHQEIRAVQDRPRNSAQESGLTRLGAYAPRFVRGLFYWALRRNPHWMKRHAGTVVVTAVGMFGSGTGWGLGFLPMHTLGLTVGGIAERPGLVDGKLSPREHLCVTVSFDHDIVDGAPAARFAERFRELVESGHGLPD